MPTIQQLPSATTTSTADEIPVSQDGTTRSVTIGALLATVQPTITIPSGTLIGRNSLGPGGPEVVTPGVGLQLESGSLSANGADHADFPLEAELTVTDNVILDSEGTPSRLPLTALRGLFTAGNNVTIDGGTISASATGGTLALPATAPLLASNGTSLTAVALGNNLSINAGTLSAATPVVPTTAPLLASTAGTLAAVALGNNLSLSGGTLSAASSSGVAAPAASALVSSTGTALTGVALGANLSLTAGTLSATGGPSVPATAGLVSSTGSSLAAVTLAGASYSAGTLTVPSYTLPAASAGSLGGVKAGSNLTIAADGTISAPAPVAVPSSAPLLASVAGSLAAVALGSNLTLSGGTLSAAASGVAAPAASALVSSTGTALTGVALGANLALSGGTLTATNTVTTVPASAPLVAAVAGTLAAVAIGANLALTGGTLSAASSSGVAAPAASALVSSTGTALTGVALGANLSITAGTLSAASGASVPATAGLVSSTGSSLAAVTLAGASYSAGTLTVPSYTLPAASANSLGGVKAGSNLTIAADGTISAPAPVAVPSSAPLLASAAGSLAAVALGSNLSLSGGTLSAASSSGVAAPAASALVSSTGTALTGVALGANLSITAGTLSAASGASVPATAGLVSSTGSSLAAVTLAGASYSAGTLTVPSYTLPAASANSLGGVKAGSNLTIAADGTISASAPIAVPSSAPLLASAAGSLAAVALGSNLTLSGGTLNASVPVVPSTAALLASTAAGSLANVVLNGLSYTGGTLTAASSSIATTAAAGVVQPDGSTISISAAGVISTTGTATVSSASPITPTGATTAVAIGDFAARTVWVEDYGAVGDCSVSGTTVSGTDNGPAFQRAVNALGSRGGIVRMAAKNYRIMTGVTISQAPVHFQGQGAFEGNSVNIGTVLTIDQTVAAGGTTASATTTQDNPTTNLFTLNVPTAGLAVGMAIQPAAGSVNGFATIAGITNSTQLIMSEPVMVDIPSGTAITFYTPLLPFLVGKSLDGHLNDTVNANPLLTFGTRFEDFSVTQVHPTPSSTAGTAWTPTAYPPVFNVWNTAGGFELDRVFFLGIYIGVYAKNCGHFRVPKISGQWYLRGFWLENCQDSPYFGFVRHWCYQDLNINRLTYQCANLDVIYVGRCDGFDIVESFGFACQSLIHSYYEQPFSTGSGTANVYGSNPAVARPGGTANGSIDLASTDHSKYCIWVGNADGSMVVPLAELDQLWQMGNISGNNVALGDVGVQAGCTLFVNEAGFVGQIANVLCGKTGGSGIVIEGNSCTVQIGNVYALANNQNDTTPAAPVISVGDSGGIGYRNRCKVATYYVENSYSGCLIGGTSGDGLFVAGPGSYDNHAIVPNTTTPTLSETSTTALLYAGGAYSTTQAVQFQVGDTGTYLQALKGGVSTLYGFNGWSIGTSISAAAISMAHNGVTTFAQSPVFAAGIGGTTLVVPPVNFPDYAVSALPTASSYTGCYIDVTGYTATGVGPLARSDGTNWRFVANGAIVS